MQEHFKVVLEIWECVGSTVKITCIRDKFETHGTLYDVQKHRSGRRHTATSPTYMYKVLESSTRSPQKSIKLYVQMRQELADQAHSTFLREHIDKFIS